MHACVVLVVMIILPVLCAFLCLLVDQPQFGFEAITPDDAEYVQIFDTLKEKQPSAVSR